MGVPFTIKWDAAVEGEDRGDCEAEGAVIRIAPLSEHTATKPPASTLLHEIIHAALYVSGLEDVLERKEPGLDETIVRVLESALFPLIPAIVKAAAYRPPEEEV